MGSAGTVNTGAIDPLEALADLARTEELTFHVDAAFGAWAKLSPRLREQVRGLERADSLALDLHKWGAAPTAWAACWSGCQATTVPSDLGRLPRSASRGVAAADFPSNEPGRSCRGAAGARAVDGVQGHGLSRLATSIEQNVAQAAFVAERVRAEPELELMAPVPLNLVTFRYRGRGLPDARLDALNAELVICIQESGLAVPSTTRLRGRTVIRLAIVNHRSRREDFDRLLEAVVRTGRELAS
jgi:glutamate/tyrosine decarboxylase-like PLP-dependent enzyme